MSILDIRRGGRIGYAEGTPPFRPSLIQDYFNSSFSKKPTMGHMALVPITLPTGETYDLSSGGEAVNFREFLESLNMAPETINNIFERRSETPPQLTIPTPVPSPTMPTPTIPTPVTSPTMLTPTMPEPNIPGFQSFSGSGREGIMNLLASRFRDLNLGMMNRFRNNPGSFYSRSPLDQTSSIPSGLQSLFFRSGNNLTEIPNSMNMMRRAVQRPSYTNTGIATSFTPNFVSIQKRTRR